MSKNTPNNLKLQKKKQNFKKRIKQLKKPQIKQNVTKIPVNQQKIHSIIRNIRQKNKNAFIKKLT